MSDSSVKQLEKPSQLVRFTPPSLNLGNTLLAEDMKMQYTRVRSDQSVYGPTDTIYLTIPAYPVVDMRDAMLTFQAQVVGGGGNLQFERNIQSLFRQVRVYIGSELVEDIQSYDLLSGMFYLCQGNDVNQPVASAVNVGSCINPAFGGVFDTVARRVLSQTNNRYAVRLHLESLKQVIPLKKIGQELRLEIILNNTGKALEQSGAIVGDESYTVSNMYFHYRQGTMSERLNKEFDAEIAANSYVFPLRTWRHFVSTELGTGTSATISIPSRFKTIQRVLAVSRDSSVVNDIQALHKSTAFVSNQNLNTYSLLVNGERFPRDAHQGLPQDPRGVVPQLELAWTMNKDFNIAKNNFYFLGASQDNASDLGYLNSVPQNSFTQAWDLRKVNDDYRETGMPQVWGNGLSTSDVASQMQLEQDYSAGNANPVQIEIFTQYEVAVRVRPGGMIDISSN